MYAKLARKKNKKTKKNKKNSTNWMLLKKKYRRQSQWHPAWASVAFIVTPGSIQVVFNAHCIHSAPPLTSTLLISQFHCFGAKSCSFSANSDRCDNTPRRSDGLRRCTRCSMKFNTFARCIFLCLPRSYRVAEKSDPIARFSGPNCRKIMKNRWFLSAFSAHSITQYLHIR